MNLGENIYRLRTENNLSQSDLADALDVSRQSVSKWENNSSVPELEKLIKMAQIFEVTIDELVTGTVKEDVQPESPPPQPVLPQPAQSGHAQAKHSLTTKQILGIILLSFGGLCLIIFTVVGIFVGRWLMGVAIALPFLLCGLICLLCKKNIGLKCAWAVYLVLWALSTIFVAR